MVFKRPFPQDSGIVAFRSLVYPHLSPMLKSCFSGTKVVVEAPPADGPARAGSPVRAQGAQTGVSGIPFDAGPGHPAEAVGGTVGVRTTGSLSSASPLGSACLQNQKQHRAPPARWVPTRRPGLVLPCRGGWMGSVGLL